MFYMETDLVSCHPDPILIQFQDQELDINLTDPKKVKRLQHQA